jgi:hypothetical protein
MVIAVSLKSERMCSAKKLMPYQRLRFKPEALCRQWLGY